MVESLILSKLNYGNVLLSDAKKYQLQRLQKVQNVAAGFVLKRRADIKDVINLKWLPVIENIDMAIAKAAYNAVKQSKLAFLPPNIENTATKQRPTIC